MANTVSEVTLRKRSTPYEFAVSMSNGDRTASLYTGRAYREALRSYWQAVNTFRFLSLSGKVEMSLTLDHKPFGGFTTRVEGGEAIALHKPNGNCKEWVTRGWSGHPLEEKMISHIPGTLGLSRDPD